MLLIFSASASFAAPLSDGDARKLIENYQNNLPVALFIGPFYVTENGSGPGMLDAYSYHMLSAAEHMGLVTVKKLPKATGPLGVPLTPPHIFSERIISELTPKGRELNLWKKPAGWSRNFDLLLLRNGKYRVDKIVRNEELKRGIDDYRVVLLTLKVDWSDEYLELMATTQKIKNVFDGKCAHCVGGPQYRPDRKMRALLKYDEFKALWTIVTTDEANSEEPFVTDNVNTYLKSR